jgi:hypothetical protein
VLVLCGLPFPFFLRKGATSDSSVGAAAQVRARAPGRVNTYRVPVAMCSTQVFAQGRPCRRHISLARLLPLAFSASLRGDATRSQALRSSRPPSPFFLSINFWENRSATDVWQRDKPAGTKPLRRSSSTRSAPDGHSKPPFAFQKKKVCG